MAKRVITSHLNVKLMSWINQRKISVSSESLKKSILFHRSSRAFVAQSCLTMSSSRSKVKLMIRREEVQYRSLGPRRLIVETLGAGAVPVALFD